MRDKRDLYEVKTLVEIFQYFPYWAFKSIYRLKQDYKQTTLGFLWEPFSLVLITVSISFIWFYVMGETDLQSYFLYVFVGYYIWGLIAALVSSGTEVFVKNVNQLINEKKNLLFYIFDNIVLSLSKFLFSFPIMILVVLFLGEGSFLLSLLLFLYVLIFVTVSAVGYTMIFGTICLFFRDVSLSIQAIMRLAFLLTPVIWRPDRLGEYIAYLWLNPFYVYVKATREALMFSSIDGWTNIILVSQSILLLYLGYLVLTNTNQAVRKQVFLL